MINIGSLYTPGVCQQKEIFQGGASQLLSVIMSFGILLKYRIWFSKFDVGLRFCIPNTLSCDADAVVL